MLTLKEKTDLVVDLCHKNDITAYEIGKETGLSIAGIQKILNNEVKKPRNKTLNLILEYIENKIVGTQIDNKNLNESIVNEPDNTYKPKIKNEGVVPYYNVEISGSFISSFDDAKEHIEFYIDYKPLNDCTAYLPYFGDSMYPLFKAGSTLAVKQITNFDVILWGEAHLVITNDNANNYKTVKCIYQHQDPSKIILRAKNPDYPGDIVINKEDILSLYIIKGKIELNEL